ncbi:uncharacterized protein [Atheta coriaria]|uniref:uncharacterized protein n=1 Tax=Dalotia coriaria TaxID=877792 RepID=UPI0031F40F16
MHRATPPPPPPATTPASRTRRDNVAARSHGRQSASALHKDRHGFRKSLTNVCLCFNQIEIKKSKSSVHHFVSVYIGASIVSTASASTTTDTLPYLLQQRLRPDWNMRYVFNSLRVGLKHATN